MNNTSEKENYLSRLFLKYALLQNKITGAVNDKHVYEPGMHFVMPFTK